MKFFIPSKNRNDRVFISCLLQREHKRVTSRLVDKQKNIKYRLFNTSRWKSLFRFFKTAERKSLFFQLKCKRKHPHLHNQPHMIIFSDNCSPGNQTGSQVSIYFWLGLSFANIHIKITSVLFSYYGNCKKFAVNYLRKKC